MSTHEERTMGARTPDERHWRGPVLAALMIAMAMAATLVCVAEPGPLRARAGLSQPTGACCLADRMCADLPESECVTVGGIYQGDGTTCASIECPGTGACCFEDGSCAFVIAEDCVEFGGEPQGEGTDCDPNPCPAPGACCYDDQQCIVAMEDECYDVYNGYLWIPDEDCEPNPCPPTAVEETTWGSIKANYR